MILNRIFLIGDSCVAGFAGEYVFGEMQETGFKKQIVNDVEYIFVWATGVTAYSITKNHFSKIVDEMKLNNETIGKNDIVILTFGGMDYEFYFPFTKNLETVMNDYCEYSIKYFLNYTKNISFLGLYPPSLYIADEVNRKNRKTANYKERYNCWVETNKIIDKKSKEYFLPTPLSVADDIFKQREKVLGIHTYDGMHLIDYVSVKVIKEIVEWVKKTYKDVLVSGEKND